MSLQNQVTNLVPTAALGSAGVSMPWWLDFLPPVWQGLIALLGFVVLILTIVKLTKEIQVTNRKLRDGS